MRSRIGVVLAAAAVLMAATVLVTGCDEEPRERPVPPVSLPGDLLLEGEVLHFLPCGAAGPRPVDDETGSEARTLIQNLGYGSDRVRSAVVLDGDRLLEVRHATPEDARCRDLLPDADLEARGNEPFWVVRVTGEEALWITPEDQDGVTFGGGAWQPTHPGRFVYEARGLVLDLEEEPCFDTMAGARFPWTASVEKDGTRYVGCALEGRGLLTS